MYWRVRVHAGEAGPSLLKWFVAKVHGHCLPAGRGAHGWQREAGGEEDKMGGRETLDMSQVLAK